MRKSLQRMLVASIALGCWSPGAAVAQDFQFMRFAGRAKTSVLPPTAGYFGYTVAGDLNHDGLDDLVAGSTAFLRSPAGWSAPSTLSGWSQQKPVLIDLDGDGDRDLVGAPAYLALQRPVLVYATTPNGLVPVSLPWPAGIPVQGAVVGHLDADGFADMIVATPPELQVPSLVLARGGPGLQFTLDLTALPAGLPPALWPELLDVDGDGDLDLLATNATSGMRLLRNHGGSFADATASLPAMRSGHTWTMAADLDGDGVTDCAATLANGDVDVLWGAPGGPTFAAAVATVPGVRGLYPADLDGDGDRDLLAEHAAGLDVLSNAGNRQFARSSLVGAWTSLRGVADVDLDGRQDVLFATASDLTLVRCLYQARVEDAAFAVGLEPVQDGNPCGLCAAGDVDGDGRTDLVTPGQTQITVEHALGGGAWRRSTSPFANAVSGHNWRTELADMDGDADLDIVVKDDTQVSVVANDGTGTFGPRSLLPSPGWFGGIGHAIDDLRIADVDADGDRDLVLGDNRGVVLIRNQGGGQYAPATVIVPAAPDVRCVEVADVDGDGDLDVLTNVLASSGVACVIAANDGTGTFAPNAAFVADFAPWGIAPTSLRAGDLDADGDVDVLTGWLRVFRNNGTGSFADTSSSDLPGPFGVLSNPVVADLDDDGDLDIGAVRSAGGPFSPPSIVILLLNDGNGRFADATLHRVLPFAAFTSNSCLLRAADFDDDGDTDLIGLPGLRFVLANHLRQCRSNATPRLGGVADLHLLSGPSFGQPGLGLLGVGLGLASPPPRLPGFLGQLELDPANMQVVAAVTTSSIGVSSAFVPVPQDAALFGLEVWFQGAILPAVGPPGFTNAVHELVLR